MAGPSRAGAPEDRLVAERRGVLGDGGHAARHDTVRAPWPPSPRLPSERPPARRVRALRARLREMYGVPVMAPHGDPLGELVLTVLSQSTNDRNRDVAFLRLRDRFPAWEAVRDAPVEEIEEAIRPGGISKVKSVRIQEILDAIGDPLDLSWMRDAPVAESQRVPRRAAGRRAQDGGVRAAVRLRAARRAGRHARRARRDAPRAAAAGGAAPRSSTTRCCASRRAARSSSST